MNTVGISFTSMFTSILKEVWRYLLSSSLFVFVLIQLLQIERQRIRLSCVQIAKADLT